MPATLLWYDLETFGTHPQWDRIAQFAAVRTDDRFEALEEPKVLYCRLSPDYLPHPDACLTTGITPQEANNEGMTERDFAAAVHEALIVPGTTTVGFNSIRFDDEFIRALFYRNFYDPYAREYQDGNARWDILDLARMCRDLRPEGLEWPTDHDGRPIFTLEELARANGLEHERVHDALSDVRATIGLGKRIQEAQPKLFRYYFSLRRKDEVRKLLNLQSMEPVVHTSGMFTSDAGCTAIVLPLSVHPTQGNVVITYDLRRDPEDWIDLPVEEIRRRVFSKKEELAEGDRIPFKGIHINRSPAVAPMNTLTPDRALVLGIDLPACLRHAEILRGRPDLVQKVRAVYEGPPRRHYQDPELQIYSGDFFPDEDREEFAIIRNAPPEKLKGDPPPLYDPRGPELLRRYIARNFPGSLTEEEARRWKSFCAARILTPEPEGAIDFNTYRREVANRLSRLDTPAEDKRILKALAEYGEYLEAAVLR